jgi:peptidoglycan/LPS O-acetylase OafA/YrhL
MTAVRIDTSLVRCLAVLLITNSHFDALYPDARLGTGGALGNTLFFLLSGYGLALSLNSGAASQEPFLSYWLRRLGKIFPVLWVVTLAVVVIGGEWRLMSMSDWFFKLFWPLQYWFVCAIVLFYALFYWFGKFSEKAILMSIVLLGIPYFLCYFFLLDLNHFSIEASHFKWIVYFQIMLWGAWLSKRPCQSSPVKDASWMIACVLGFFGLMIALAWLNLWKLQFLLHLILFPFALFTFRFLSAPAVLKFIRSIGFYPVVVFLAGLTLEIYLVQVPFVPFIAQRHWEFPIGWLVSIVSIPALAFVASKMTGQMLSIRLFKKV